jgi:hypothetical protein
MYHEKLAASLTKASLSSSHAYEYDVSEPSTYCT